MKIRSMVFWFIMTLLIVVIPLLINWAYISNLNIITTVWSGGEFIQFYGSVLGFLGIALTIRYTQAQAIEDRKHTERQALEDRKYAENQALEMKKEQQAKEEYMYKNRRMDELVERFRDVCKYLNPTYLINLSNHASIILKDPIKLLNTHRDVEESIKITTYLSALEREHFKDSITKIENYGEKYSELVWEIYILTSEVKRIEQSSEFSQCEYEDFWHQAECDKITMSDFPVIIDKIRHLCEADYESMIGSIERDLNTAENELSKLRNKII